jgi:hypothetical protein
MISLHPRYLVQGIAASPGLHGRWIWCAFGAGLVAPQAQSIARGFKPMLDAWHRVRNSGCRAFNALPG